MPEKGRAFPLNATRQGRAGGQDDEMQRDQSAESALSARRHHGQSEKWCQHKKGSGFFSAALSGLANTVLWLWVRFATIDQTSRDRNANDPAAHGSAPCG